MQSVLVTGGAGFIGQNLVHAWRAKRPADRPVVVDAMTYAANVRSLEPLIGDGRILFVKGDIRDAALMRRLFDEHKFIRVVHLAAESHIDRSIADPEAFLQTNVLGTFTRCRRHLMAGVRTAASIAPVFFTYRPMKSTVRWRLPIRLFPNPRRTVPTRPTPPARRPATTWYVLTSRPTACRR
jgi:UDP-glucose 4-epimerase